MSWFTSLRDSVENGVGQVAEGIGLNVRPVLSVAAGGDPSLPAISLAGAAAPAGSVGRGGVVNRNPDIFAGVKAMSTQTWLIVGGIVLLVFFMCKHSR